MEKESRGARLDSPCRPWKTIFMRRLLFPFSVLLSTLVLHSAAPVHAQQREILDQKLNSAGEGYTVLRVWGSRQQIGYAIGATFADDIVSAFDEVRDMSGNYYSVLRGAMTSLTFLPKGVEEEFNGLVEGVKSVRPEADVDATDMKVLNTFGDWSYACRSHSCWGSRVEAPYSTLSTRRLDFGSPLAVVHHHVLYAIEPSDEPVRWVNLAWPGFVSVVTGVNEYGSLVSVHDFQSSVVADPGVLSRTMAARHLLSSVPALPIEEHLAWAQQQLSDQPIATGTFINFYAPNGYGGVFTCAPGKVCSSPRTPQQNYRDGEVLITTNSQTDGHSTPSGASFLDPYYDTPGPKTLESHFGVMVSDELHMMTVGFRSKGDMRLLAHGRTSEGWTPRIDVEWSTLFPTPTNDAGADAEPPDAPISMDATADSESEIAVESGADSSNSAPPDSSDDPSNSSDEPSEGGCGCKVNGSPSTRSWYVFPLGFLALGVFAQRRRGGCAIVDRG